MNKFIAAVNGLSALSIAVQSNVDTIFYLNPSISTINNIIKTAHDNGKHIYIHMDMADGIGKDKSGVKFVKDSGVDGIISTRSNIIKYANELNLFAVQRFFAIDSHSIDTIIETIKNTKPHMIEIMPAIATKAVEKLKKSTNIPIIAGGLIETKEEAELILSKGASNVSTSKKELWCNL